MAQQPAAHTATVADQGSRQEGSTKDALGMVCTTSPTCSRSAGGRGAPGIEAGVWAGKRGRPGEKGTARQAGCPHCAALGGCPG